MNHDRDPRIALRQELEAKQTLLDQLRALAADDPDFFTDDDNLSHNLARINGLRRSSTILPSRSR